MAYQTVAIRNEDLPPTKPSFQIEDRTAFTIGAWIGVCFALAAISAAVTSEQPQRDEALSTTTERPIT